MTKEEKKLLVHLIDYLLEKEQSDPVAQPKSPSGYQDLLDLELTEQGVELNTLQTLVSRLIDETPKTNSTLFFNQLFGGRQAVAAIGDMIAVLLNSSMYTYKVAGPMVLVEQVLVREIADRVGYDDHALGTMAAGGSMTNLKAMIMARDRRDPQIPLTGVGRKLVGYTSAASHYSIRKNAALCGIGREAIRKIETDDQGRLSVRALQRQMEEDVEQGFVPFFVNVTAGTTVLGAFDPIDEVADLLTHYPEVWLHVDGAYCGAVIWSRQHRHLVKGVERSDSFSVNPHKMLGTPLSTSFIVVKEGKHLYDSFSEEAAYLFQTADDGLNLGKISMQCGRRNDALKFWMLYKSKGHRGIEQMVDKQIALAEQCRDYLRNHPDYTLYPCDQSVAVCFNYRDIPAEALCNDLYRDGKLMVGYGSFRGTVFVRLVIVNANNAWRDLYNFFNELEAYADSKYIESEV